MIIIIIIIISVFVNGLFVDPFRYKPLTVQDPTATDFQSSDLSRFFHLDRFSLMCGL